MRRTFPAAAAFLFTLASSSLAVSESNIAKLETMFLEGNYEAAAAESGALIKARGGSRDRLYYIKALSELKARKFQDARESFGRIVEHYSRSDLLFDAELGIGDAYLLEGNNPKALSAYNNMAVQYNATKNIAIVYERLSQCYAKMGAKDKADGYIRLVRETAPGSFEARTVPEAERPAEKKSPLVEDKAAPAAGAGRYFVQVGSFKNKRNAQKLATKLKAKGYKSFISIPVVSKDKFYRVKVGDFARFSDAQSAAESLKSDGYKIKLCTDEVCE